MKKSILLFSIILFMGCLDQGSGILQKEEILLTFENPISGEISLDFTTFNGYIEVYLWDDQTYKIDVNKWARASTSREALRRAEALNVDFSETGGTLAVKVEQENNTGADIKAYLPKSTFDEIELDTTNGYIQVEDITASSASLETTNGFIEASIHAEDIRVETTNGRIGGFYQGNNVKISTANGRIDVECGDGGDYTLETTNGSVEVQLGSQGNFDISTTNGSASVTVKGDFSFDLKTTNGAVTVDADNVTYTQDDRAHKKGHTLEGAGLTLTVSTTNSNITVVKQ
ncbi:MAG: DUF4097 family beta strand repeat protein [Theionarchaea archaeon]|nr:DUF4097 family beta strand repeat protein [Theionarchaea archaeon]